MHVLHRHVVAAVDLAEVEHLHDVDVQQLHADPRLVDEQAHELAVPGQVRQHLLDDQDLLEPGHAVRAGPPHLGHATRRDLLEQVVVTELEGVLLGQRLAS